MLAFRVLANCCFTQRPLFDSFLDSDTTVSVPLVGFKVRGMLVALCTALKATGLLSCLQMKIMSFRMKLK